jgi:hypothetical protein
VKNQIRFLSKVQDIRTFTDVVWINRPSSSGPNSDQINFALEQAMKAQTGSCNLSLISAADGVVVNAMPWPPYPRERDAVTIV